LYEHWLEIYGIKNCIKTHSSNEINEVFTLFLVLEEGPEFLIGIVERLECMLEIISQQFSSQLCSTFGVSEEWDVQAEILFNRLDVDKKGHLEAENVQFFTAALMLPEVKTLEPIMLRKHTLETLKEMNHTSGLVTLKNFKSYLINKKWVRLADLSQLTEKFQCIVDIWRGLKKKILKKEITDLSQCCFLAGNKQELPSVWNQSVILSVMEGTKSNFYKDWEKMHKFLRFSAWLLGSTPSAATKGQYFIQGTFIKDIPEFAVLLMSNYLELEGQFHTSVSLASINQQTMCRVSSDARFQTIHKCLTFFDKIMNSILYEVMTGFNSGQSSKSIPTPRASPISFVGTLNSTSKTTSSASLIKKTVPRINIRQQPISVSVRLTPSRSARTISRNSSTKSARSKSPMLGRLESYDKVMERLKK
jgi:hypothetical protein